MIEIHNSGPFITWTNYWDTPHAARGHFYLSWNGGAARLLVPDVCLPMLADMRTGREVIISRGPWPEGRKPDAFELLFEDGSNSPFAIHLGAEQTDRSLPTTDQGGGFEFVAYARTGRVHRWPARYREVARIPCLEAWTSH